MGRARTKLFGAQPSPAPLYRFTVNPLNAAVFVYFNRFLKKKCSDFIGKVIAPSLVVHLLLNKVQSTALDELSSVMCLP